MTVPAVLHDLIGVGVEFETDGARIRWRNAGGRVTPDVGEVLRVNKAEVIAFLTGRASLSGRHGLCCTNPVRDSCRESSMVAGLHEQTDTRHLQDHELAGL